VKQRLLIWAGFLVTLTLFLGVAVLSTPQLVMPVQAAAQVATVQTISTTPLTPTYTAITTTDGLAFANNGQVFLHVKNTAGASAYITVETPYTAAGLALADLTFTLEAAQERLVGPFEPTYFNVASGTNRGQTIVKTSRLTETTVAAIGW
jgi:hypothetical protein